MLPKCFYLDFIYNDSNMKKNISSIEMELIPVVGICTLHVVKAAQKNKQQRTQDSRRIN